MPHADLQPSFAQSVRDTAEHKEYALATERSSPCTCFSPAAMGAGALTAGLAVAERLSDEFPAGSITFSPEASGQVDRSRVSAGASAIWHSDRAARRNGCASTAGLVRQPCRVSHRWPGSTGTSRAMIALGGDSSAGDRVSPACAAGADRTGAGGRDGDTAAGRSGKRHCMAFSETRSAWQGGGEVRVTGRRFATVWCRVSIKPGAC